MPTESTAPTESSHSSYATGTMTRMMRDELPPGMTADDLHNQGVSAPPTQLDSFREDFEGYSPEDVAHEFFDTQGQGSETIEVRPNSAIQQPSRQPSRKPSAKVDTIPEKDPNARPFYCKTWFIVVAVALVIGGVAGGIGGYLATNGGGSSSSSSSSNENKDDNDSNPPTAPTPSVPTAPTMTLEPSSVPSLSPTGKATCFMGVFASFSVLCLIHSCLPLRIFFPTLNPQNRLNPLVSHLMLFSFILCSLP